MKKKKAVPLAWLISFTLFSQNDVLCSLERHSLEHKSVGETTPKPRSAESPLCKEISLDQRSQEILKGVKDQDPSIFHSLLKQNTKDVFRSRMTQLKSMVGPPFEISAHSQFELGSIDNAQKIECLGSEDPFWVYPIHGYPEQKILWLHVFGEKDLARIFLNLVKDKKDQKWKVGAFHGQKWTAQGKPPYQWYAEAQKTVPVLSFFYEDIAKKLFLGAPRFYGSLAADRVQPQLKEQTATKVLQEILPKSYAFLGSQALFATQGLGIGLKFLIPEPLAGAVTHQHCSEVLKKLKVQSWFTDFQGIRCSYFLPGEDLSQDGKMGSLWLNNP